MCSPGLDVESTLSIQRYASRETSLLVIRKITRVVILQINRVQYDNIYMPETNVDVAFRLSNSL